MHVQALILAMGSSTAPFSPPDISGLKVWLKCDAESYANNDPITTLTDQSGNGNTFTGSGTARPTFKTSIVNSKPVARFDGSNDQLTSSYTLPAAHSLFMVFNRSTLSPLGSPGNGPLWRSTNLWVNVGGGFATASATVWAGAFEYIAITFASSNINGIWVNATNKFTSASGGSNASSTTTLGNSLDGFSSCDIAELIIYDSALSSTDRGKVQTYLASKYAI